VRAILSPGSNSLPESGFDYNNPSGTVPEPGTLMFAVVGLAWLLVAPRGRVIRLELLSVFR
jgi:PEP-CTERM motif-containing protein